MCKHTYQVFLKTTYLDTFTGTQKQKYSLICTRCGKVKRKVSFQKKIELLAKSIINSHD